jgi:hypothetical protein
MNMIKDMEAYASETLVYNGVPYFGRSGGDFFFMTVAPGTTAEKEDE